MKFNFQLFTISIISTLCIPISARQIGHSDDVIVNDKVKRSELSDEKSDFEQVNSTCNSDELNHSVLIECNLEKCEGSTNESIWPEDNHQVVHVHSSRSGNRFVIDTYPNLNFEETETEKLYDINTTLYVDTKSEHQEIHGFGTTLDAAEFLAHMFKYGSLDKYYEAIFRDLFGKVPTGIEFNIIRLVITNEVLLHLGVPHVLQEIDWLTARAHTNIKPRSKIKLILNFKNLDRSAEVIKALRSISTSLKTLYILEFWAVAIDSDWALSTNSDNMPFFEKIQEIFSTKNLFGEVNQNQIFQELELKIAPYLKGGLLLNSENSTPYNILDYVSALYNNSTTNSSKIVSVGREKPSRPDYGDWRNAQNYAVEILNHLKHGANGFVERYSSIDLLKDPKDSGDCSIYNLQQSHKLHFRGPMYYAIGHFSRHIVPGSKQCEINVFTQPNMFGAHYLSFKTPQNYVVSIVLNNNEHLLPLRVAVDNRIMTYINVPPKSLNTIIIKP